MPVHSPSITEIPAKPFKSKMKTNYLKSDTHAYELIDSKVSSTNFSSAEITVAG